MTESTVWLIIGFIGQGLFFGRILVQWIASERRGESVVPRSFWYFSIVGSLLLFAYAVHQRDIVIMMGQAFGILVYGRNLTFRRPKLVAAEAQA
ncbi:lipid A biosynthesis protein [Aureimonas endophytica]|uniref:Lipid A biosynthesis protein n=1 Tax=Aureimonas endophytica TaxID=2027858 RepID=A0A916ZQD0_9HYPH|nr:lipid-A-disaccharide synthase N-terminal domain-containing protein [Aureimonas endophytica]GGE08967.1 lipid A biosynthesis protein [Aureimonas endophytica]